MNYYDGRIGSRIRAFDWYQNQRPWITLNGVSCRDCPKFKSRPLYPPLSKERLKLYELQIWPIHSLQGPSEQNYIYNFGEKGAWAYLATAEIFWVPHIILGTGKATNFKFCTHFNAIDRNKSPFTIGKSSRGRSQGLTKIFRASIYMAHRAVIFAIARTAFLSVKRFFL